MGLDEMAALLNTEVKILRRFFKSDPQWSVLNPEALTADSLPAVELAFSRWFGPRQQPDCLEPLVINTPLTSEEYTGDLRSKLAIQRGREIAERQNEWLQNRLIELGLSVTKTGCMKRSPGKYDTTRRISDNDDND